MLAEPLHDLAQGGRGLPRIRTSCIALDAMGEAIEVSLNGVVKQALNDSRLFMPHRRCAERHDGRTRHFDG